jgi:acyl-coenzyme A synthetase/AMP-(fatty) acid ligase
VTESITFSGRTIELASAEAVVLERDDVVDAVAIGVDDAFLGQALALLVVVSSGTAALDGLEGSEDRAAVDAVRRAR